jgi:hypothetical protein
LVAVLLLAPDVGTLGYLANPRVRAVASNVFHAYLLPSVLVVGCLVTGSEATSSLRIVWFVHISMDRVLGYGLKYAENFKRTYLNALGRSSRR